MIDLPSAVLDIAGRGDAQARWVDRLPVLVRDLLEDWGLSRDGTRTWSGTGSVVLPVRTPAGAPAVLKVGFPHPEADHEHLALTRWSGRGAVRLLRADPHRSALLLERLHDETLDAVWDLEACEVVAGLYGRLHVPAGPPFRPLSDWLRRWSGQLAAVPRGSAVPHRLVEQAASIAHDLVADQATDGVLVHGDLHYDNVLAADREPWLVIDPKPVSGDPHYEPAPMLWNRWDEVVASGGVRDAVRRRFLTLVDTAGLDEERARDWVVLRVVLNVVWDLLERQTADREWLTTMVSIAKAVQD